MTKPTQGQKTVFLSSVALGLESYRDAAYKAIEGLDGYHCVRMEDFGARSAPTPQFCADAVRSCDIFVGIVGQRYGSCPPGSELSYTETEHEAAIAAKIPTLMFLAPEEFGVPANLIEPEPQRQRLRAFRDRVRSQIPITSFESENELAAKVIQAIHNERENVVEQNQGSAPSPVPDRRTYLLFPFVANILGYDTGIAIAHTGSDPFGTASKAGTCKFHYFGRMASGSPPVGPQVSSMVLPGEVLTYVLSSGSSVSGLDGRGAGISGYLIVECDFPYAHGFAYLSAQGVGPTGPGFSPSYLATVIKRDRSDG